MGAISSPDQFRFQRIAAQDAVRAELPDIAEHRNSRLVQSRLRRRLLRLIGELTQTLDPQIDLKQVKADRFQVEVEFSLGQLLQLLGKKPLIPGRPARQSVVGDAVSADLIGG